MNIKSNVKLMYLIVFLQGFVFYGPISTIYRQSRGLSMENIFLIESIAWILMIIFEIPWGWFADKFGYKRTLIFANLIFFISKIVFYKAYSVNIFFIERILISLALSGISGCDIALLYSSVDKNKAQMVFGRYNAFSTAGLLFASLLSSIFIKDSIDKSGFFTIIPYGIALVLTLFIKDNNDYLKTKPNLKDSFKTAFSNKQIIIFVFSIALIREIVQVVVVFLNQIQYLRCEIDIKYFGILLMVIQIIKLISAKTHKLTNKFEENNIIKIVYIIIASSCFFLMVTNNSIISILCIVLIAGGMSLIEPIILDIENKSIITGNRATILSIYAMATDLIAAFVNIFIGKTADISIEKAFKICTFICIFAYVLLLIYLVRYKKSNF